MTTELVVRARPLVRITMFLSCTPLLALAVYCFYQSQGNYLPGTFFVVAALAFWLPFETQRYVLTSTTLELRQFGVRWWRVRREDVELRTGARGFFGEFPLVIFFDRTKQRKLGEVPLMRFRRSDLDVLLSNLN